MATSLWQLLSEYKIEIPILQRDYAQGRQTGKVPLIRERFLNALLSAINDHSDPLELDFVYGYTKENQTGSEKIVKSFIPLDGQQRLTTLFLLHWYIAINENHLDDAKENLAKFTYETRHSSRVFCKKLVVFKPEDLIKPIKETIINQPWFFTAWKNDPTINSMLTMLNDIQVMVNKNELQDVWPLLTSEQPQIVFHLLPMGKLGLPDDLYIKMNSRGKELTEFEYFKSRFSEILSKESTLIFNQKIDQVWSDLFWDLFKDENNIDIAMRVDNAILRYFQYVTDILISKKEIKVGEQTNDFDTYKEVYAGNDNRENVEFLFSCLNVFCSSYLTNPGFFDSILYIEEKDFETDKTRLFFQNSVTDLFKKCADKYDTKIRTNLFSIGEQLMLYACIVHLINSSGDFNSRIRTIRNLIANSEDTVRKENMPSLLNSVSEIILYNRIEDDSKFSSTQIKEENIKQQFIEVNPELKVTINKLEDHQLLQGCLAMFNLDPELDEYATAFNKTFSFGCTYETISRALLSFGDYSQIYDWRWRLGNHNNSVWRELFTPSQRRGEFQQTKVVLYALLSHLIKNTASNLEEIINEYLAPFAQKTNNPKDWKYYFIKYPEFRKWKNYDLDGFYYWHDRDKSKPYECVLMRRSIMSGFHWSLFLFALNEKFKDQLSLADYNAPLILVKGNAALKIFNLNQGFRLEANDDDESKLLLENIRQLKFVTDADIFQISQNEEGIDLEDRIDKGAEFISKIFKLKISDMVLLENVLPLPVAENEI